MKTKNVYLIFSNRGTVRMRQSEPDLNAGEVAIKLKINIPESLFLAYPTAEINIDEDSVIGSGNVIDVENMASSQLDEIQRGISIELATRLEESKEGKA